MTFVRRRWTVLHTFLALAGVVLASIVLPIGLKSCAKDTLIESQAPVWEALQDINSFQNESALKIKSKDELVKIIRELAETQAGLELKLKTLDASEAERTRLGTLLKMQPSAGYETKVARIIGRDIDGWWQQIYIDLGRSQGVKPGLGVISRYGIVGRVREAYEQTSVVELVTSPRFRMAVQTPGDERPFVYQGLGLRFGLSPTGSVQALQPEMAAEKTEGRTIVTTGLSGSFPEGLPIGILTQTTQTGEGGLLEGRVKLPAELQNLREVSVLIPYR
jgi:rod shape-determining protein MreC